MTILSFAQVYSTMKDVQMVKEEGKLSLGSLSKVAWVYSPLTPGRLSLSSEKSITFNILISAGFGSIVWKLCLLTLKFPSSKLGEMWFSCLLQQMGISRLMIIFNLMKCILDESASLFLKNSSHCLMMGNTIRKVMLSLYCFLVVQ